MHKKLHFGRDTVGYHLGLVLPWLGLGIFNKMDITQGGLL